MRDNKSPASLGELLGDGFEHRTQLTFDDLPKLLGQRMPEITKDRVGRFRLMNALQMRFGDGYRNIPMLRGLLDEFDKEIHIESLVRANRRKS